MGNTIVIGGGPAGMMAAYKAAEIGMQVVLLEKNDKLGKKLYITGKGRCNVTNDSDVNHHLRQQTCNAKFLYSAFYSMDSSMLMALLEDYGCPLKVERGQRVFPLSDKSSDIIAVLGRMMKDKGVDVRLRSTVKELIIEENHIKGVELESGDVIEASHVIVATGGSSYAMTGSTGDGYRFAKYCGHHITQTVPGLVPLETEETDILKLQGLSLRNVELTVTSDKQEKVYYRERGEMLFTHFGVSGPLVLSASSYLPVGENLSKCCLSIDLKPALSHEQLDKRLIRDFEKASRKALVNGISDLLPSKLIPIVIERSGIDPYITIHDITKEQRASLVKTLKGLVLHIKGRRGYNEAIITRGGIDVKDIDPHTMESRKVKGLFFAGEVMDLDALTGGFNLQIAFSTGALAGISCCDE